MATNKKKAVRQADLADVITEDGHTKLDLSNVSVDSKETIPDSALINVKSNAFGRLIYVSKRTGERIVWEKCGEVQQLTLSTLRGIKLECVKFYREQWIIPIGFADENADKFTPADIYKQLFVTQYYKNLVDPSDYEELCTMSPGEIKEKVSYMSTGAKENLVVALNTFIEKGVLDSIKAIRAFEEALGCELRNPAD
jgi:hypothetical protein